MGKYFNDFWLVTGQNTWLLFSVYPSEISQKWRKKYCTTHSSDANDREAITGNLINFRKM